jgi:hypothetical protein
MKVRIIDGRIAEVNTKTSNVDLPDEYLGTHLSKYLYDGDWSLDPEWVEPQDTPPEEI